MEKNSLLNELLKDKNKKKQKPVINKNKKSLSKEQRNDNNIIKNNMQLMKSKYYLKKIQNENHLKFALIIFLLLFKICLSSQNLRKLNLVSRITTIQKGNGGIMEILKNVKLPDAVTINGVEQSQLNTQYQLEDKNNTVVISYNSPINNCDSMFYEMSSILYVDLSEFDASQVTNMHAMFYECTNLKSINLNNLNTTSVENLEAMFYGCSSLLSLDLSKLKTSKNKSTNHMFFNCTSLNFINLSNFDTSQVTNMNHMFYDDQSLISLDLSSFDISSAEAMHFMFFGCKSLIYINLNSFAENKSNIEAFQIFNNGSSNLTFCIDDTKSPLLSDWMKKYNTNNDCNNICFSETKKLIIEKKICIDDCSKDDTYIYEKDNICYKDKQNTEDIDTDAITDYKNSEIVEITDTDKPNNDESTNIIENDESTNVIENDESTNVIENDESTYNTERITEKIENTTTIQNFSVKNFFKEGQQITVDKVSAKDEIIKNIKYDLMNGDLDTLLQNVTNGAKQDLIARDKDIIYQITTSENQKNNQNNISTINLGECEKILRGIYNISDNLPLIILKIDYYMPGVLIPIIGYEVYHPENKSQLNLDYCKDELIKLNIPVSINEDKVFKHDPSSDYYNDECYSYTTDNGTDILLKDRQNEFIDNNLSLCENDCTFTGYNQSNKKALCECVTKPNIELISDIIKEENILANEFNKTEDSKTNFGVMKCLDTLFSEEGLLTNIGSYLLLFTFLFYAVSVFIFYKCGYQIIEDNIQAIIKSKKHDLNKNKIRNKIKNKNDISVKNLRGNKKKVSSKTLIPDDKNKKDNKVKKSKTIKGNPLKKRIKFKKENSGHNGQMSSSKLKIKSIDITFKLRNKNNNNSLKKKVRINSKKVTMKPQKYIDCELNLLDYKNAIIYDKRPFSKYYLSLLFSKQLMLFSFYPNKDYNIKIIKISIFFLALDIIFAVNTIFFSNSIIHKIYSNGGVYNLSFFIGPILFSFIISYVIINLIRYFSLSERVLIELKREENNNVLRRKATSAKKRLNIIYIIFYIFGFIFLMAFWIYSASFCAVYQNSQIFVIKNALIDLGILLLYPFIYNLFPAFFRMIALGKNMTNEFIFKFSKFLQLL